MHTHAKCPKIYLVHSMCEQWQIKDGQNLQNSVSGRAHVHKEGNKEGSKEWLNGQLGEE